MERLLRVDALVSLGLQRLCCPSGAYKELSKFRELIESCPSLSDYEKSLIFQIDLEEKTVTEVAKKLGKAKSTVSSQHGKAFQKFYDWLITSGSERVDVADLDAVVFQMLNAGNTPADVIAIHGNAEKVMKLAEMWTELRDDKYWEAVNFFDDHGLGLDDSEEDVRNPLLAQAEMLFDVHNSEAKRRYQAEKELQDYEKAYGELEELVAEKAKLTSHIEGLKGDLIEVRKEVDSLQLQRNLFHREKRELEREVKAQKENSEELTRQTGRILINRELLKIQVAELKNNFQYYTRKHGRNVKIGDLISRKDFPLMYLVVDESEDGRSWETKIFDRKQLEELRKKYKLSEEMMEGQVSKKEVIENWEIVILDEDPLRL